MGVAYKFLGMNSIFNYIRKMQGQSVEVRKRFAYLVAGIITGIIFVLWLSAKISILGSSPQGEEPGFDTAPLQSLKDAASQTFDDLKTTVNEFKDAQNSVQNQQ